MSRIFLVLFLLLCLEASYAQKTDNCSKVKVKEKTCWCNTKRPPENGSTFQGYYDSYRQLNKSSWCIKCVKEINPKT